MTSEAELLQMIEHGVAEVFVGYVPRPWLESLGMEASPNRRYQLERQVSGSDQLHRFGELCRNAGVGFVVAINDHYYAPNARELIPQIVATGLSAGVTGFIIADLQLLHLLAAELGDGFDLIVSCEAGVYNTAAADQFIEAGATRIVFPREMRLSEMSAIVAAARPDAVELEAFIAREYCVYSSALCFAVHGYGHPVHFCCAPSESTLIDRRSANSSVLESPEPGWCDEPRFLEAAHALNRCGFCALETLLELGVRYLKIPGRSDSALRALKWLRPLLESGDLSLQACRSAIGSDAFCSDGNRCYYNVDDDRRDPALSPVNEGHPAQPPVLHVPQERAEVGTRHNPEMAVYLPIGSFEYERAAQHCAESLEAVLSTSRFVAGWEEMAAAKTLATVRQLGIDTSQPPDGIVLGLELCGLRLPKSKSLRTRVEALQRAGFRVSLAMPVTFQAFFGDVCDLLDGLSDLDAELVVNDWGLLRYAASHWAGRIATGRLMNRMKRDQFARDDGIHPVSTAEHQTKDLLAQHRKDLRRAQSTFYGYPYLTEPFYRDLLHRYRVEDIGVDVLPTPLSAPLPFDFNHTLYLPWTYITSGRACRIATAVGGAVVSYPTESCRRPCSSHLITMTYPWEAAPTIQTGTAVSMDCSDHVDVFLASMSCPIARLVVEPFVPL